MIMFKERLKELRKEKMLSQDDFAKIINVSQRSISSWEKGSREPGFEVLAQIAKYFDVTTDYLLGLEK